jgi:hypothetical protein
MIAINDAVKLDITIDDIKLAIRKSLGQDFHRRDNLRQRNSNIQFDCLLRGYVGETGITKWFKSYGITFASANCMADDQGNIDIDLLYRYGINKEKSIEIKTSLVPDYCARNIHGIRERIATCIRNFDIKLIRRNNESIKKLQSDIHVQIYYGDLRGAKDEFLTGLAFPIINNISDKIIDEIYDLFMAKTYLTRTYLVGWIDKITLIEQINNKSEDQKIWKAPGLSRDFWTCKIQNEAKAPIELIEYIKNLK